MSSKNALFLILLTLIFTLIVPLSAAKEDFVLSSVDRLNVCECSSFDYKLSLQNTGDIKSTYYASIEDGMFYSRIVPSALALNPGEKLDLVNHIRIPCGNVGEFQYRVNIETKSGFTKALDQIITSAKCGNVGVKIANFSKANCPCSPTMYEFEIQNIGEYADTYSFSVEPYNEFVTLSENAMVLPGNSAVTLYAYVNLPCAYYGDFNLTLVTQTKNTRLTAKTPFYHHVTSCYQYADNFPNSLEVCEGTQKTVEANVQNLAAIKNTYYANVSGFSSLDYNAISLPEYGSGYYNLTFMPPIGSEGDYELYLQTITERGEVYRNTTFNVKVSPCFRYNLTLPGEAVISCKDKTYAIVLDNTGTVSQTYTINVSGASFASIASTNVAVGAGNKTSIDLDFAPLCNQTGNYTINVDITLDSMEGFDTASVVSLSVVSLEEGHQPQIVGKTTLRAKNGTKMHTLVLKNIGVEETTYTLELVAPPSWIMMAESQHTLGVFEEVNFTVVTEPVNLSDGTYPVQLLIKADDNVNYTEQITVKLQKKSIVEVVKEYFRANLWLLLLLLLILLLLLMLVKIGPKIKERHLRKVAQQRKEERKDKKSSRKWIFPLILLLLLLLLLLGLGAYYYKGVYKPFTDIFDVFNDTTTNVTTTTLDGNVTTSEGTTTTLEATTTTLEATTTTVEVTTTTTPLDQVEEIVTENIMIQFYKIVKEKVLSWFTKAQVFLNETQLNITAGNETDMTPGNETQLPKINETTLVLFCKQVAEEKGPVCVWMPPPEAEPMKEEKHVQFIYEWNEDSDFMINLSQMFYDADFDQLAFTSSQPTSVVVVIDNGVAKLFPQKNWHGNDTLVFYADDGRGGITSSPNITLNVLDAPEEKLFEEGIISYFDYVLLGFFILFALIAILEARKAMKKRR